MLLQKERLQHLNSIAHEGKVVVFATDADGQVHYTIKQDGFEDSYLNTPADQRTGWEKWKRLEFPNEANDDASVVEKETEEFTRQDNGEFLIRSRYQTQDQSAVAPVQLVSGVGHIYVFRQSKENTLFCDRFVLDGMTNELTRKLEVRFKRSRQKYKPTEDMKMGSSGLQNLDSLDYRDTNNDFFYESTTELKLINNLHNAWFSVVQVPTNEHEKYRWHIFAYNSTTQKVQLTTLRTSDEGLFDPKDYTVLEPKLDSDATLVPRSIPGIIQRTLDLQGVAVTNGLAATKYDIQQEQETKVGPQLMRTATKIMLAVPTDQGTAAISFSIAGDGTLSQIDETPQNDVLRSHSRDVLLPLNTLEEIKSFGDTTTPPQGTITGFSVGTEEDDAEDLVKITSPETVNLASGDMVEIQNTTDYNGLYSATKIDEDTFTIELPANEAMGNWETVEEEGGLIFDGMVTAYEKTPDGKLKVTASNHGLDDGDEVLLTGTQDYDNTYQIQKIDDANFVIQRQWSQSEAVNVKLESRKRRGIVLDGVSDYVDCGNDILPASYTKEAWIKWEPGNPSNNIVSGYGNHAFYLPNGKLSAGHNGKWDYVREATANQANTWIHVAVTYDSSTQTMRLYKNGKLIDSATSVPNFKPADRKIQIGAFNQPSRSLFKGLIADVRIWDAVRTEKEIQDSMYLQLTGKEVGLVGYWRLGAISEGKEREVVDFSVNGNNGIVHGDAYVGGVILSRTLRDGLPAVKYSNDELVAVSQRATYLEEFEFKVNPAVDVNNADGNGNKIFQLSYWGKTSRSADEKITISAQQDDFESLGNGWYRATCRFTIPDGVAMLRTFEIANVRGTWNTLEIRKHHIRMVSDAITEAKYGDGVSLTSLADNQESLRSTLKELGEKELEESALIEEKRDLETKIALLKSGELGAKIAVQQKKVNELLTIKNTRYYEYERERNSPFNYFCKIKLNSSQLPIQDGKPYLHAAGGSREIVRWDDGQEWQMIDRGNGYYKIKLNSSQLPIQDGKPYLHAAGGSREIIRWDDGQEWQFEKTGQRTTQKIEIAEKAWQDAEENLKAAQAELQKLQDAANADANQLAAWEQRLQEIIAQLIQVQTELNSANTTFIDAVKTRQQVPQTMPDVATDGGNLVTQGALLGFVHPAGRLNAIETCEGNVQLTYFDDRGQMRQTLYDATSDGLNTAFEQWIPDSLRTCLNFNNGSSVVKLNYSIYLGENSTVEAWFAYPFAEKLDWHILASSQDNEAQIVVYQSKYLGLRINGVFFDCGYDLEKLSPGWHHLTITTKEPQQTSSFYIDGEKVGIVEVKPAVQLDSQDDFVSLPELDLDYSVGLTIEAWVHYASLNKSRIIDFGTGSDSGDIVFGNKENTDTLFLNVGGVTIEAPSVLETEQWMHLAATLDGSGNVTLYKNGLPVASGKASVPPSINRQNNFIGKSNWTSDDNWDGEIAEVRLWNLARTQTEIQENLGKTLKGDELGLVGYWRFAEGSAKDSSQKGYDGTIQGTVKAIALPAKITSNIHTIGNGNLEASSQTNPVTHQLTALKFDGSGDYIECGSNILTNSYTKEAWIQWESGHSGSNNIVSGYDKHAFHLPSGKLSAGHNGHWGAVQEATIYQGDTWIHVAVTYDSSTQMIQLYTNGKPIASATNLANFDPADRGILIGAFNRQHKFKGAIAEVRVWNYVRTPAEIQGDMGQTLTGSEQGLAGYWPLRDGSAKDYSPNGNDGTIHGNPQTVPFDQIQLQQQNANQFGKLAEVRIWGVGLSDEEIAVNSKTLLSGNEPGLLAYYPMNEATGNEVRDRSGNNRHGIMQGASWWGCAAPIGNLGHTVMQFDGQNDYIHIELNEPETEVTHEFWFKTDSSDSGLFAVVIGNLGANGHDRHLYISGGQIKARIYSDETISSSDLNLADSCWHHLAHVFGSSVGGQKIYLDGKLVASGSKTASNFNWQEGILLGYSNDAANKYFQGQMAEFRVWKVARTPEQIRATMHQSLSGKETDLLVYWPLNAITPEGTQVKTPDLTGNYPGMVHEAILAKDNTLPIGGNALVSSEYSTIAVDPGTQRKSAMMRRFFASPALNGAQLLPEKRIEQLQLQWIGNAQFAPTLLGYIEGAPPIPSENLTVQPDYNGATSVELNMSEDVEFSWNRAQDSGLGASFDLFAGVDTESFAGIGVATKAADVRAGFKGNLDFSYQFLNESNITSSSSTNMTDRLELRGTPETNPKFPHLGTRFIPKNVGYALVISSLADVFITKLERSGKMIGYQVRPVEGIPPDVNTITFLMNPAYTMNGSLDGMTGSSATSQRFFKHVPEMRNQYGSLYPASYYRLKEAYNLKQAIEREDKRRESYFQQFNARLLDESSLSGQIESGAAPGSVSVQREEDKANTNLTDEEKKAQQEAKQNKLEQETTASQEQQSAATKQKQSEIDSQIADQEKRAHATESFAGWQKKMENILIRAGKRNIVNTYVWDGDGGMRTEAQSFASTAQHTIGGSFSLNAGLGFEGAFGVFGAKVELTALATVNLTQTMSKSEARSKGIQLNVDLSGVEHIGLTDYNDYPIMPGEKVDRYRFMSFYLDGSTDHFRDFFDYVVDPEWLRSNDEEARALRQAMGKANKTWRVLHRVTYVERPALMGFGRDLRKTDNMDKGLEQILSYFDYLDIKHAELKSMMTELLVLIKSNS